MPLNATNFHVLGPVKSADMLQFYELNTGVMLDQPVTFRNALSIGGNQGLTTVPLKVYGATGQNTNLLDLYLDRTQSQPGFGLSATGAHAWGPGGAAPQDTYLTRIALQNGHASDTAGLLVTPLLEVAGPLTVNGLTTLKGGISSGGATLTLGNTQISGTLGVTGATTLSSTLGVAGVASFSSTINLPAGGSITATRHTFQGGAWVGSNAGDRVTAGNHLDLSYDLAVGRNMTVAGSSTLNGLLSTPAGIATAAINSGDWYRLNVANMGIFNTALGIGINFLATGPCLYPSNDPIVGINSAQTLTAKSLTDPRLTGQVTLGGANYTFPAVGSSAGLWRYIKAWGQALTIYLTNGTFILGTVQYGSGQYVLQMGNSVSCYCDGSNWWVL